VTTETQYMIVTGNECDAVHFENMQLMQPKANLPACAHDVLDGRGASSEYWAWLVIEWFAAQLAQGEPI